MVARWFLLLLAASSVLVAFGAASPAGLPPSALRVTVAAVVAVLAPLFWPGVAGTSARTAARAVGWSLASAALAALLIRLLGGPVQAPLQVLATVAALLPMLLLAHAWAALLERRLLQHMVGAAPARETAGRTVALALAMLGALPLFLGPAVELLSTRHEGIVDATVAASPLVHLAVASGNDLLRNAWLYQHSNLAALAVTYPGWTSPALFWGLAAAVTLGLLASWRRGRPDTSTPLDSLTE